MSHAARPYLLEASVIAVDGAKVFLDDIGLVKELGRVISLN